MWDKELGLEPDIEWSILAHLPAYKLGQKNCDLCLIEKTEIAKKQGATFSSHPKKGELEDLCSLILQLGRRRNDYRPAETKLQI